MYTLVPPSYSCFILNLALIGRVVSGKKTFEYYGNIHAFCPGMSASSSPCSGSIFFRIINLQSIFDL